MFQMLGVFAEFERVIIRERVNAGLARAKANGNQTRPGPGKAVGGGANTGTQGRWRCHPQDWPETWNRHQRCAAGFQAGAVATLIGTLSGRNGPLPNPTDFSFGAGHNVDREPFNPMSFGTAEITSEPNGPSLLEASLKEKRNNVHDRSPRSGSPN
jgi:hypothetical protein